MCYGIALTVLAVSIPFYALARTADNPVSHYGLTFLCRYLPQTEAGFLENIVSLLKASPTLCDGMPSGLWCLAWTLILLTIWRPELIHRREARLWCLLPCFVNGIWEALQYIGVISGTGTLTDCVFGGIGSALALAIHIFVTRYQRGHA